MNDCFTVDFWNITFVKSDDRCMAITVHHRSGMLAAFDASNRS